MSFRHCRCHGRSSDCTSLRIIADKILRSPAVDPPPHLQSPSHHIIQKPLGGSVPDEYTLSSSPISYRLLGVILWGWAEQTYQLPMCRFPIHCNCSTDPYISSAALISPFYFPLWSLDHWQRYSYKWFSPTLLCGTSLSWYVWAGACGKHKMKAISRLMVDLSGCSIKTMMLTTHHHPLMKLSIKLMRVLIMVHSRLSTWCTPHYNGPSPSW